MQFILTELEKKYFCFWVIFEVIDFASLLQSTDTNVSGVCKISVKYM